jgi:hypothetical protein
MSLYFFNLKHRDGTVPDADGTDLPDDAAARLHASAVARELLRHHEVQRRAWRLQICSAERAVLFELLFADVDTLLDHLRPELKASMRELYVKTGGMNDTIADVRATLHQLRGTLARADGLPWLAAVDGRRL